MKSTIEFKTPDDRKIAIPVQKITGIIEVPEKIHAGCNLFIATGCDSPDGENGFYVKELYRVAKYRLDDCLDWPSKI